MFLNLWVRQKKITIHSLFGSPCINYFGGNGVEFSISMFVKPPPLQWYFKSKFNPVQNQSLKILVTLLQ